MIPISDDNPTLRRPYVTWALLALLAAVWILVQGAGFDRLALAASICNWGLIPGELTGRAPEGLAFPIAPGLLCVVDRDPTNVFTPITSMFLHGSWLHLLGNGLFLWVFGNNVEDAMGRLRFVVFYLLCGLMAAAAQIAVHPEAGVPMVGASGAIAGVLGGYLVLFPRARVNMLFIIIIFIRVIPLPAYVVLISWIFLQLLAGLPQLTAMDPDVSAGVAFWAHIGGFVAGLLLVKLFENKRLTARRQEVFREVGGAPGGWRQRRAYGV